MFFVLQKHFLSCKFFKRCRKIKAIKENNEALNLEREKIMTNKSKSTSQLASDKKLSVIYRM
jgi:hypothetical protein